MLSIWAFREFKECREDLDLGLGLGACSYKVRYEVVR